MIGTDESGLKLTMEKVPGSLAELGALLGDPVRAAILQSLSEGTRRPAGELALLAGASPQAASLHLGQLVDGGLLAVEKQGRHRFYRLASSDVAEMLEGLTNWTHPPTQRLRHDAALCHARLCYDHLAGHLGVAVLDSLSARGMLALKQDGVELSEEGRRWYERQADHTLLPPPARRPFARLCLDWTERRHHLGGYLGARLTEMMLTQGYLLAGPKRRSLLVTSAGTRFFCDELGIAAAVARPSERP
ncbi:ArsR/SmtB family transcription factor [Mesorhizobium sp. UC22_110]|uniref:ArsR/SmtB family transcription factor n=1 Tax=unclassified Mesorhizobium TaxID=325217 RepID=UPI00366C57F7